MARINKKALISKVAEELDYSIEDSTIICDIVEKYFFFEKKNQDLIIQDFIAQLNVDENEASRIYEFMMNLIHSEIQYKLRHPFKR